MGIAGDRGAGRRDPRARALRQKGLRVAGGCGMGERGSAVQEAMGRPLPTGCDVLGLTRVAQGRF